MTVLTRMLRRAGWLALGAGLVVALSGRAAEAATIQWTLTGATLSDGATAFGFFDYDAATQSVSNLDITTTAGDFIVLTPFGSVSGGHSWLDPDGAEPPYPASGFAILDLPLPADLTGTEYLGLSFAAPLTDAGGTVALLGSSGEGFCTDSTCAFATRQRSFTDGSLVGTPVPEPPTVPLVAGGLVLVALLRRREICAKP